MSHGAKNHNNYRPQGNGLTPDLLVGPVPKERRRFNDVACAVLYLASFGAMAAIMGVCIANYTDFLKKYQTQIDQYAALTQQISAYQMLSGLGFSDESSLLGRLGTRMLGVDVNATDVAPATAALETGGISAQTTFDPSLLGNFTDSQTPQTNIDPSIYGYDVANNQVQFVLIFATMIDIKLPAVVIFAVFGTAVVLSTIFLYITPYVVGCLIWTMIALVGIIACALGVLFLIAKQAVIGIIFFVIAAIYFLVVYCYREYISRAITLIRIAGIFFQQNLSSIFISLLGFLFLTVSLGIVLFSYAFGVQAGLVQAVSEGVFYGEIFLSSLHLYWSSALFLGYVELGVAIFFAHWYFSFTRGQGQKKIDDAFSNSISWPLTKHFGSLCFGSFLVAAIKLMESALNDNSAMARYNPIKVILRLVLCCIKSCLERFTSVVIIMIALTGDSYCAAASDSFHLIIKKFGSFLVLSNVSHLYQTIGSLIIGLGSTAVGFFILFSTWKIDSLDLSNAQNSVKPILLLVILILFTIIYLASSLVVARLFLKIVTTGADCCLFYMTVDKELCNGQYVHGPDELLEIQKVAESSGVQNGPKAPHTPVMQEMQLFGVPKAAGAAGAVSGALMANANMHTPGMNMPMPGMNMQMPGMNMQMPGMNMPMPGMNMQVPGMNMQVPGVNVQTPGMNMQMPGVNMQVPGVNVQTPGMNMQMPGVNVQTPGMNVQVPGVNVQTPGMNMQMPGVNVQMPGVNVQMPGANMQVKNAPAVMMPPPVPPELPKKLQGQVPPMPMPTFTQNGQMPPMPLMMPLPNAQMNQLNNMQNFMQGQAQMTVSNKSHKKNKSSHKKHKDGK